MDTYFAVGLNEVWSIFFGGHYVGQIRNIDTEQHAIEQFRRIHND